MHCVKVVDKAITMDNLRLQCLVVNACRGTARHSRYKYSITGRWKFCSRLINSRLNSQYLPSYRLDKKSYMSCRLVPKSVTLNELAILYFDEFLYVCAQIWLGNDGSLLVLLCDDCVKHIMLILCHILHVYRCHRQTPSVQHGIFGHRQLQARKNGNSRTVWVHKRWVWWMRFWIILLSHLCLPLYPILTYWCSLQYFVTNN